MIPFLLITAALIAVWISIAAARKRRRNKAVKAFFDANPAAKQAYDRTVKYDLSTMDVKVIPTKNGGKRTALIMVFGGQGLRTAIDGEGKRYACCDGTWHDA